MSKQSLLLVDGDTRSLRVLEVSLRKAGFSVTPAETVRDALDKLELHAPDLIISETKFPTEPDGFELRRRVRAHGDWGQIPFVFLTAETAIENKIRGLELGVDEYLTKPIYIKEIVTRINILLQKRQRQFFDDRKDGTRFAGRVADMPVVDVIQTIEVSRKSGVINFSGGPHGAAAIYFRDGKVIDAEAGTLQGEDAVYRLLTWNEGDFEVVFRTVRRREAITTSSQGLLMEGMRRLDEWTRLLEQLPPLSHRFEIDVAELAARLGDVPDDNNRILRLIDGKRTLHDVIDSSDVGDLECLQAIARLYFEGMLTDLEPDKKPKRDTGKPMPLVMVEDGHPTPIEEVVSGPIDVARLSAQAAAEDAAEGIPRRPSAEEIESSSIVSEEPAEAPAPGPLLGGYRQSSLRLIDEAVAAAQAIDPTFLEDTPPANPAPAAVARVSLVPRPADPRVQTARDLVEKVPATNGDDDAPKPRRTREPSRPPPVPASIRSSEKSKQTSGEIELSSADMIEDSAAVTSSNNAIPRTIDADEPPDDLSTEPPTDPNRRKYAATVRREDSGMRMIGSHGRDRAEASGELVPAQPRRAQSPESEPERELVTILPRRITREVPTVQASSVETTPVPEPARAVEPPPPQPPASPPPRLPQGHGVVARDDGPSTITKVLLVLASVLIGATVYTYCHGRRQAPAQVASAVPQDAAVGAYTWDAPTAMGLGLDAPAQEPAPADARIATTVRDAGVPPRVDAMPAPPRPDASVIVPLPPGADAGVDRVKEARELADKAHDALEEGDAATALSLLDQSLKLRKTARTYIDRARALQRLDRIDDALASLDDALALVKDYPPAWETKGNILWAAKRYDEAKVAYQRYLDLAPGAKDADVIRQRIAQ